MMRTISRAGALALLAFALSLPAGALAQPAAAAPAAPEVVLPGQVPMSVAPPPASAPRPARVLPRGKGPGLFDYTEEKANVFKIGFALAVVGLVLWGMTLAQRGRSNHRKGLRHFALGVLGMLGVAGWFNYGKFHAGTFVHVWEHYHYYVGAKYLPELHYARLYECSAIAEVELRGAHRVKNRNMRDIANTNLIGPTDDILAHPERCKDHFTAARWDAFKADVAFFMKRMGDSQWERSQKDHGFNGTPWWSVSGTVLANLVGPASERTMNLLGLLDPILLVLMFAAIWWAFGVEIFAVAASFFAVNFPSRYWWNGGAFLRYDYLAAIVIGICMLRKSRPVWGGALLAFGGAARLFPVMFSIGPAVQGIARWVKEKTFPAEHRKIVLGALLATALLVPASLVVTGAGLDLYDDFQKNTLKHSGTPLTNHMGLRTLMSWFPGDSGYFLKDSSLEDPWRIWKETRVANYERLKLLFVAINLFGVWAVWRATRKDAPWVAATLSGVVLVTTATELTCYYYAYLLTGAFLMEKRKEIGLWLIALGVATHAVVRFPIWDDDKYVIMSLLSLVWSGWATWSLIRPELATVRSEAPAMTPALAGSEAARPAAAAVSRATSRKKKAK